jgi:hypothetical protein
MSRPATGNNLAEYALPLAVLSVVIVGVLFSTTDVLRRALPAGFGGKRQVGESLLIQQMGQLPNSRTVTIRLSDGTMLTLQNVPTSLHKSVETVGSNGTTELLLANLNDLIIQLEGAGKMEPEDLLLLKNLANQGHRLAEFQRALEEAHSRHSFNEIPNLTFPIGQERLTYLQVWERQGTFKPVYEGNQNGLDFKSDPETQRILSDFPFRPAKIDTYVGTELFQFMKDYGAVKARGLLQDPALNQVISHLAGNIAILSDSTQDVSTLMQIQQLSGSNLLKERMSSVVSGHNASDICATSQSQDNGVRCL